MVRVHFGPPLQISQKRSKDQEDWVPRGCAPKWTRKAALDNSPVDCCNRRGFPAGKRVLGPPLRWKSKVGVKTETIEFKRVARQNGLERRLLTTVRWTVVTAVAFPQESESLAHHIKKENKSFKDWLKFRHQMGFHWVFKIQTAPWKLNIVIMMQLWEGNSKG